MALVLASSPALAGEQYVGPLGAPWCEKLPSLKLYMDAMLAQDTAALEPLQDCVWLKPGVRVEILRDYADFGTGRHVVQVRVFGNGASVDGYSMSNALDGR